MDKVFFFYSTTGTWITPEQLKEELKSGENQ